MPNRRDFIWGAAMSVGAVRHELLRSTHIPLAMRVLKAASVIQIEGVPMGSSAAPYAMIAHFQFASSEAVKSALADPAMAEVRAGDRMPRSTSEISEVDRGWADTKAARLHPAGREMIGTCALQRHEDRTMDPMGTTVDIPDGSGCDVRLLPIPATRLIAVIDGEGGDGRRRP
jgi:hypothetical protein